MKRAILSAALAAGIAIPALAEETAPPQLSLDEKMLLRCSAAFAIVAGDQSRGDADALVWPPLGVRGKEYFVQASAQIGEAHQLSDAQVEQMMRAEANDLQTQAGKSPDPKAFVASIMQPCLLSLEVSGV